MTDRGKVVKELSAIIADMQEEVDELARFGDDELRGGMSVDCGWYINLLEKIKDAVGLLREQEPRMLSFEEARAIKIPGTLVWLETSGGYEGTRYKAIPAIISDNIHGLIPEDEMRFYNTAGRAWSAYNRDICGWRLWTGEPNDEQRLGVKWGV